VLCQWGHMVVLPQHFDAQRLNSNTSIPIDL
jgi:hypothetical protein